jgi:hypothetical protein
VGSLPKHGASTPAKAERPRTRPGRSRRSATPKTARRRFAPPCLPDPTVTLATVGERPGATGGSCPGTCRVPRQLPRQVRVLGLHRVSGFPERFCGGCGGVGRLVGGHLGGPLSALALRVHADVADGLRLSSDGGYSEDAPTVPPRWPTSGVGLNAGVMAMRKVWDWYQAKKQRTAKQPQQGHVHSLHSRTCP